MDSLAQFLVYVMVAIFFLIVFLIKYNKNNISRQLNNGKYYSIEITGGPLCLILLLFLVCLYIPFFIILSTGEFIIELLIILIIITFIFIILFYFFLKEKSKFSKNKKEILKNGIMVEGVVKEQHVEETMRQGSHKAFYMIVEYVYNGEKLNYVTPQVEFNFFQLIDLKVDVYIYNDRVFVTNFKLK